MEEKFNYRNAFLLTVVVLILIVSAMVYKALSTEAVHIEINDGIALSANRMGRVINMFAFSANGKKGMELAGIEDESYPEALDKLVESGVRDGFFSEGDKLSVSIWLEQSSVNDRREIVERNISEIMKNHSVRAEFSEIDADIRRAAQSYGISVGKYRMICELCKLDPTISVDVYKDYSMRVLRGIYNLMKNGASRDQAENALGADTGAVMRFIHEILFQSRTSE